MKAVDLNGTHLGKTVSVQTKEIAVAGKLSKIIHTTVGVSLSFSGSISLNVKTDDPVEILE